MRAPTKHFTGMVLQAEPHLLPDSAAQDLLNATVHSGGLVPVRAPVHVVDLAKAGTARSIYRFGANLDDDTRHWFHWLQDTDVARGPIPDDTQERTYFTEAGQPPRVTDATMATADGLMPTASYLLGVPAPTTQAAVVVQEQDDPPDNLERQSCLLAYTWVTGWGEEGPPNEVSAPFNAATGDTLVVSALEAPPVGAYNITHKRLYLSITDATGTAVLRFWKEIPAGELTYTGEVDQTELGEAVPENAMVPPPAGLFGLMAHPGGFMIGFDGQQVRRSEVFKPSGWPYFTPIPDEIVGGAVFGQATLICTKGGTYMATQADPITFNPLRLEGNQPCVSKRSIRPYLGGVAYASPDGMVMVDAGGGPPVVITDGLVSREQWQAYNPSSILGAVHDGRYFAFWDNGADRGALILEIAQGTKTLARTDVHATAAYTDGRRDELFLVLAADGAVYKWDAGAPLALRRVSKRYIMERPQNIGAAQVVADTYPVTFRLDATVQTNTGPRSISITRQVSNARGFRLPGSYRAREYEYTVTGPARITEITLASTLANLSAE